MIVNFLCSNRKGGLENAFLNLTQALENLEHPVEQWLPADSPHFDVSKTHAVNPRGYYDFREILRIRKRLKSNPPQFLISHNSRATYIAGLARIGLPIPLIAFSHGYKTKRFKRANKIVVLTEHMKQHFIKAGYAAEKLSVLPNMMAKVPPLAVFRPLSEIIQLCFIGRLSQEKGLLDLLHALALLKPKKINFMLHIAGSGDDAQRISSEIRRLDLRDFVTVHGWIDGTQQFLNNMDILLVPSTEESFGLVILEAAAYGCPTISTCVPGPHSQITHGMDGWLAKPANPESLAHTIEQAIAQATLLPAIRAAAHERAQIYSMAAQLPNLQRILHDARNC